MLSLRVRDHRHHEFRTARGRRPQHAAPARRRAPRCAGPPDGLSRIGATLPQPPMFIPRTAQRFHRTGSMRSALNDPQPAPTMPREFAHPGSGSGLSYETDERDHDATGCARQSDRDDDAKGAKNHLNTRRRSLELDKSVDTNAPSARPTARSRDAHRDTFAIVRRRCNDQVEIARA